MEDRIKDEDEIEIDLGRLFEIFLTRKKIVAGIVGTCTIVALICSLIMPPEFQSNSLVQTHSSGRLDVSGASAVMSLLGGGASSASTTNYMEMMKSRAVIVPIFDQLEDITPEQREKMSATGFAKKHVDIQNIKGTNLITVIGKGKTPEEAQMISSAIVDNFLKLMTEMNQSSQSYMVKFLNERIDTAKKESDEAAAILEEFSKEHKVYSPDDQGKAILEKTAIYDKAIRDFQVQQRASEAKLYAVNSELEKQNENISSFNIADSSVVVELRKNIANKEVSIVQMEQKYTEKHPDLKRAREELQAMKDTLSKEVISAVKAGTSSMNPTYSALLQEQAMAQVDMAVASASEAALREHFADSEDDMAQLSDDAMEYLKLKRNADIKNEVYVALVKQSEQAKIEATMKSMDIRVIDKANLPIQKSAPRRTLITLGGMAAGIVISLIYGFWIYRKEEIV